MITTNQMHPRRIQHQFQTFRRKGSDANCITRAKKRVGALSPYCAQGSRKIAFEGAQARKSQPRVSVVYIVHV